MKKSTFIICALLSPFVLKAQGCPDFYDLMKEGNNAKDYEVAYRKYDSAEEVACTQEQRKEAKRYKSELFQKINGLREKAEKAERDAKQQTNIAVEATKTVEQERQNVELERQKAEREKDNALKALNLVKLMSDSVSEATKLSLIAQEKISLLIQLNDDEGLGNLQSADDNYEKAIFYYSNAILKIEKTEILDSSLITKKQLLTQKLADVQNKFNLQKEFNRQIRMGDSLVERGVKYWSQAKKYAKPTTNHNALNTYALSHNSLVLEAVQNWSGAHKSYLYAKNFEDGKDTLLKKLALVESYFGRKAKPIKRVKGEDFNKILNLSMEANLLLGEEKIAKLRVRQALRRHPDDLSFIKDNKMSAYAKRRNQSFLNNLSFYVGVGKIFEGNPPLLKIGDERIKSYHEYSEKNSYVNNSNVWAIGMINRFKGMFEIGLEYSQNNHILHDLYFNVYFNAYYNPNIISVKSDYLYGRMISKRLSTYFGVDILKIKNKKWKTSLHPLSIQGIIGLNSFTTRGFSLIFSPPETSKVNSPTSLGEVKNAIPINLANDVYAFYNYGNYYANLKAFYLVLQDYSGYDLSGYDVKRNYGLVIGPRLTFFPIKKLHPLGFYTEIIQNIPLAKRVSFNLADVALQYVEKNYTNTPSEVNEFFNQYWDYDIEYKSSSYKFTSGWSLKFGLIYKL